MKKRTRLLFILLTAAILLLSASGLAWGLQTYSEDFEGNDNNLPANWWVISGDDGGSGQYDDWYVYTENNNKFLRSTSYEGYNYTPENYVVSDVLTAGPGNFENGKWLIYTVWAYSSSFCHEHYEVRLYKDNDALADETAPGALDYLQNSEKYTLLHEETLETPDKDMRAIELAGLEVGADYRLVFVHNETEDQWYLNIDSIWFGDVADLYFGDSGEMVIPRLVTLRPGLNHTYNGGEVIMRLRGQDLWDETDGLNPLIDFAIHKNISLTDLTDYEDVTAKFTITCDPTNYLDPDDPADPYMVVTIKQKDTTTPEGDYRILALMNGVPILNEPIRFEGTELTVDDPLKETFDTVPQTTGNNVQPQGWTIDDTAAKSWYTTYVNSAQRQAAYLRYDGGRAQDEWLITREFNVPAGTADEKAALIFASNMNIPSQYQEDVQFRVDISVYDPDTGQWGEWATLWSSMDPVTYSEQNGQGFMYNVVDLSDYENKTVKLAFVGKGDTDRGIMQYWYVDDVEVVANVTDDPVLKRATISRSNITTADGELKGYTLTLTLYGLNMDKVTNAYMKEDVPGTIRLGDGTTVELGAATKANYYSFGDKVEDKSSSYKAVFIAKTDINSPEPGHGRNMTNGDQPRDLYFMYDDQTPDDDPEYIGTITFPGVGKSSSNPLQINSEKMLYAFALLNSYFNLDDDQKTAALAVFNDPDVFQGDRYNTLVAILNGPEAAAREMCRFEGQHFRITKDLDMSLIADYMKEKTGGFIPFGYVRTVDADSVRADLNEPDDGDWIINTEINNGVYFAGRINGYGHTISNLTIDGEAAGASLGLFGLAYSPTVKQGETPDPDAVIDFDISDLGYSYLQRITLRNFKVTGNEDTRWAGCFAGIVSSDMYSNFVENGEVTVTSDNTEAGLFAGHIGRRGTEIDLNKMYIRYPEFDTCSAQGLVSAIGDNNMVGGFAGYSSIMCGANQFRGQILVEGNNNEVGGLLGYQQISATVGCNVMADITVEGNNNYVGGLTGRSYGSRNANGTAHGTINADGRNNTVGGISGYAHSAGRGLLEEVYSGAEGGARSSDNRLENMLFSGHINTSGGGRAGGIMGRVEQGEFYDIYYNRDKNLQLQAFGQADDETVVYRSADMQMMAPWDMAVDMMFMRYILADVMNDNLYNQSSGMQDVFWYYNDEFLVSPGYFDDFPYAENWSRSYQKLDWFANEPLPEPPPAPSGSDFSDRDSAVSGPSAPVTPPPAAATGHQYITGANGLFRPGDGLTRAEAAAILARLSPGFDENKDYGPSAYSDVADDAWYAKYVAYLSGQGVISGYQGLFRPNDLVTRAEFAKMLLLTAKISVTTDTTPLFNDIAGHWAVTYINQLKLSNISTGYGDGSFAPNQTITRAEAVTMTNKAFGFIPDQAAINATATLFVDVPVTHWAYYQIMEAAR